MTLELAFGVRCCLYFQALHHCFAQNYKLQYSMMQNLAMSCSIYIMLYMTVSSDLSEQLRQAERCFWFPWRYSRLSAVQEEESTHSQVGSPHSCCKLSKMHTHGVTITSSVLAEWVEVDIYYLFSRGLLGHHMVWLWDSRSSQRMNPLN